MKVLTATGAYGEELATECCFKLTQAQQRAIIIGQLSKITIPYFKIPEDVNIIDVDEAINNYLRDEPAKSYTDDDIAFLSTFEDPVEKQRTSSQCFHQQHTDFDRPHAILLCCRKTVCLECFNELAASVDKKVCANCNVNFSPFPLGSVLVKQTSPEVMTEQDEELLLKRWYTLLLRYLLPQVRM